MHRTVLMALVIACLGCGDAPSGGALGAADGAQSQEDEGLTRELAADLRAVAAGRVYFGHHSVGWNIIDGMSRIAERNGVDELHIAKLEEGLPETGSFFAHSGIGHNKNPKSKIDGFEEQMRAVASGRPDVAFMKFCFVDFHPYTDVDLLFSYYQSSIESLSAEHPETRFLHATVPLTRPDRTLVNSLRRALGRLVWEEEANVRRFEFNQLLRATYGADQIVDIAAWESRDSEGTPTTFEKHGQRFPQLNPAFTDDGGHLNEIGGEVVATEMIRVLARSLRSGASD
jgi:hypothetical protein